MTAQPVRVGQLLLALLVVFHVLVIIISNYLVQLPVEVFGLHTTWGAFSFPLIFLATDLGVRLLGKARARQLVAWVMLPALVISYGVSVLFQDGHFAGWATLASFNGVVFRISLASFCAYALGQLLDIQVFDRLRRLPEWWLAPSGSSVFGQLVDTLVFFSIAFWHSDNAFMASHWQEIAMVDYAIKLAFCFLFLVPAYGVLLRLLLGLFGRRPVRPGAEPR